MTSDLRPNADPPVPRYLRVGFGLAAGLVGVVGIMFLVAYDTIAPRWPWAVPPFNARFLGAIYLSEAVGGLCIVLVPRWLPARVVVPASLAFTGPVLVASLLSLDDFDTARSAHWGWWVLYAGYAGVLAYALWRMPRGEAPPPTPARWRTLLLVQGVVAAGYGLLLFVAPDAMTGFWPWAIDSFHGRLYAAVFLANGVGSLLLARRAAGIELITMGGVQLALGALSIVGVLITDAEVDRVDWASGGTWAWTAAFALLALGGAAMVASGRAAADRPAS